MLKFAVIGCGNLALKYSIPALLNSGKSKIVVCIDTNINQGKIIKEKYNIPFETSLQKALDKYQFDAVYISTPIGTHKELVLLSAKNKKQILCEKSLASNLGEVSEIVANCKKNNVALFEGFMYQFHTQHQFVKNLINKGEIGIPFNFQANFGFPPINKTDFRYCKKLGGGAVLDAGSYTIHAARHFFALEPINSYAVLENEDYEVEIRGTVLLNFGNSKTANLTFGFNNMYQSKYVIWGTKGIISLERAFALPSDFKSTCTLEKQGFKEVYTMEPCDHFKEEIIYFYNNFKSSEEKEKWYQEAINQAKALDKLFK